MTATSAGEAARLVALADYDIIGAAPPADLVALTELAAQICGVPSSAVNLIDDSLQHQVAVFGMDAQVCDREDSMCSVTLSEGCDLVVDDASQDARFAANPWVAGQLAAIRFYASTLLRTPAGHPIGTLCVFDYVPRTISAAQRRALTHLARQVVDVLELRKQTRLLDRTLAELSRSHEQLAHFAGQISHDLKTPLTATIGFTELLEDMPTVSQDPVARGYVERCTASGRRMLAMIDDLLDYARVGGTLNPSDVALDEIMPQVLDDLGSELADADVRWEPATVRGDPAQLRVLLQNLVGNSARYRRPGSRASITVTVSTTPEFTELRVIDDGRGIPEDKRLAVLAPLARLDLSIPGTGLGLATCQRIAAAHAGRLAITESPGGGTTVTVMLARGD